MMPKDIRVKIIGDHPHRGEWGHIPVNENDCIEMIAPGGIGKPDMFLVVLEDCPHGTESCYATKRNVMLEDGRIYRGKE